MHTYNKSPLQYLLRTSSTWALLFLISAGLGYPTLSRFDPRRQLPDASIYARIATDGPSAVETPLRFRVLVPYLARAVFVIVRGHTGSWDPLMFSFLFINACFVATTSYLLLRLGTALFQDAAVALLAAALYLLNFASANVHLAALVDAAEACLLLAVILSLYHKWWTLLPILGLAGSLAKESFVPFSIVTALGWYFAARDEKRWPAAWIAVMAVVEFATLFVLQSGISGHKVLPWNFVSSMNSPTSYAANLWHSLVDRDSWYILLWLLPLGVAGMKYLPRAWRAASGTGVLAAVLLNAYHSTVGGGGGGLGRYVFDVAGPLLSLSAAMFLATWGINGTREAKS